MTAARRTAVVALCLVLLSGCTSFAASLRRATAPSPSAALTCPASRARPDPARPRIGLDMRLSDDLRTVTGTEAVRFTPDRPVSQLVFRLVPNGRDSAGNGNRLTVDGVRGRDVTGGSYDAAGAAAPGGLYRVGLRSRLAAGHATDVTLSWTLTLGHGAFDRFGTDDGLSWWGSGAPLLAWQPGVGWAEEPFTSVQGETATSPAADTTVRVSAPAALTLLMTGTQAAPTPADGNRRSWTSAEPAARDVSVAAGPFATRQVHTPSGIAVTVGVLPGSTVDAATLADWTTTAVADLEARVGTFPFRSLTVPMLPGYGGGIEYPGSILLAAPSRAVLVHEVAHMWFYGMVGDDQYRDPWLDEAFATYAEALVDGSSAEAVRRALAGPGSVGAAIGSFGSSADYFRVVYGKGGAALLTARNTDPAAFDAAVRCYVDARAWSIATPRDLAAALRGFPAALDVLVRAGALTPGDLPR